MSYIRQLSVILVFICVFCVSCSDAGKEDASAGMAQLEQEEPAETLSDGETAQKPHPGEAPYQAYCASCHDQVMYKAPSRFFVSMMGAQNILNSMNSGMMSEQASELSAVDRRAIAE